MTILDRLLNRPPREALVVPRKAVSGPGVAVYSTGPLLTSLGTDPRVRAAAYLKAYRTGWFYKAESRISADFAGLRWSLTYEDTEGDNAEEIVAPANSIPFDALTPGEQFLRLSEQPNPRQTGFQLRQQAQIRLDMAGWTFLYLENGDMGALPTAIYGISPTRMWPSLDPTGVLIGWVMDRDVRGKGIPFTTDEIIPIRYASDDDDPYGVGVVEAIWAEIPLTNLMASHIADVLSTGGRLAGMAWPKDRALTEDEFTDAQRAWRNVTSDPNSARRLLLFPEPMEYQAGAVSPGELKIPELAVLNRDTILSAFPIDPTMLGVPLGTGLNSGETRRYIRRDYWEGTIHPRVDVWEDTLQSLLVPRYEREIGRPLDFDIEEPNLDDAQALTEKADAMSKLVNLGFDGPEVVSAVGLDHIKYVGVIAPPPTAVPQPNATPQADGSPQMMPTALGRMEAAKARRRDAVGEVLPGFTETMQTALTEQRDRLAGEVERAYASLTKAERKASPETWWDKEREDRFLRLHLRGLYLRLSRKALTTVANAVDHIVLPARIDRVTEAMLATAADRITGINETTREAVAEAVTIGARRGYSIPQIVSGVPAENYAGIMGSTAFDAARAEVIARTETMLAYNEAALRGYQEYDVQQVQAIDGDYDPVCAARDGQVFTTEEALAVEDHPNGTLDWAPLSDKAWHEPAPSPVTVNVEPYRPPRRYVFERDSAGKIAAYREEQT